MKVTTKIACFICICMLCSAQAKAQNDRYEYECVLDWVGQFHEGLCCINIGGKWGFVDDTGYECIPAEYEGVSEFREQMAAVRKNNLCGYVLPDGYLKIPMQYDWADSFSEGLAAVYKNDKWGYIDTNGDLKINFVYDYAGSFKNGEAEVIEAGKIFYIDKNGKQIKSRGIKDVADGDDNCADEEEEEENLDNTFSEGFARVMRDGKYCIIDKNGNPLKLRLSPESAYKAGIAVEIKADNNPDKVSQERGYAKALEYYQSAADEGYYLACYMTGYFNYGGYGTPKDYKKALKYLQMSIDNDPDDGTTNGLHYLYMGMCYYVGGNGINADLDKAIEYIKVGATKYRNDKCYNQLAYCYVKKNRFDDAFEAIDNAISIAPNDANYYDSKGELLLMQGRVDEALEMWNKVMEVDPNFLGSYPDGTNLYNELKAKGKIK